MQTAISARARVLKVKAQEILLDPYPCGDGLQIAYRKTWKDVPIISLLPRRGILGVRCPAAAPERWEAHFDHDRKRVAQHVAALRELPELDKPVIRIEPIRLARTGGRGYAAIHVSRRLEQHPWADDPRREIHFAFPEMHAAVSCQADAEVNGERVAERASSFAFRRRPIAAGDHIRDVLFVVNEVRPGDRLKLELRCSDGRLRRGERIYLRFHATLSAKQAVQLTPNDVEAVKLVRAGERPRSRPVH